MNTNPNSSQIRPNPGAALDLSTHLDATITALGVAMRKLEDALNTPSGGVLLILAAKSTLSTAHGEAQQAAQRLGKLITLCHAVHELEMLSAVPSSSHLFNDQPDDQPDPYADPHQTAPLPAVPDAPTVSMHAVGTPAEGTPVIEGPTPPDPLEPAA